MLWNRSVPRWLGFSVAIVLLLAVGAALVVIEKSDEIRADRIFSLLGGLPDEASRRSILDRLKSSPAGRRRIVKGLRDRDGAVRRICEDELYSWAETWYLGPYWRRTIRHTHFWLQKEPECSRAVERLLATLSEFDEGRLREPDASAFDPATWAIPEKLARAELVVRAVFEECNGGSKYYCDTVTVLGVLKNDPKAAIGRSMNVFHWGEPEFCVPDGVCTLYLVRHDPAGKYWGPLEGRGPEGSSHVRAIP